MRVLSAYAVPNTRSECVFAANGIVTNRFKLCAMTAKASRQLSPNHRRQAENINEALRNIASSMDVTVASTEIDVSG
jgi:hypothetical protein